MWWLVFCSRGKLMLTRDSTVCAHPITKYTPGLLLYPPKNMKPWMKHIKWAKRRRNDSPRKKREKSCPLFLILMRTGPGWTIGAWGTRRARSGGGLRKRRYLWVYRGVARSGASCHSDFTSTSIDSLSSCPTSLDLLIGSICCKMMERFLSPRGLVRGGGATSPSNTKQSFGRLKSLPHVFRFI